MCMACVSSIRSQSLLMITYLVKLTCKYTYYNKKNIKSKNMTCKQYICVIEMTLHFF